LAGRLDLIKAVTIVQSKGQSVSDESPLSDEIMPATSPPGAPVAAESRHLPDRDPGPGLRHHPQAMFASSAGCGCEACRAGAAARGLVFALGQLGYDPVSEARRDSLRHHMWEQKEAKRDLKKDPLPNYRALQESNPQEPRQLLEYLKQSPWEAASLTWTLKVDQTPVYAIVPAGPFAQHVYKFLADTLEEQLEPGDENRVDWVSVPGYLAGHARLSTGQTVPIIVPELRGMYSWNTKKLLEQVCPPPEAAGNTPKEKALIEQQQEPKRLGVLDFLDRLYHELRNLGVTSRDRALNYAATNPAQVEQVFGSALKAAVPLALDTIEAEPSSYCRPGSDCWDVKILFFNPQDPLATMRKAYRFTVDVSDVVPVMVGPVRSWATR